VSGFFSALASRALGEGLALRARVRSRYEREPGPEVEPQDPTQDAAPAPVHESAPDPGAPGPRPEPMTATGREPERALIAGEAPPPPRAADVVPDHAPSASVSTAPVLRSTEEGRASEPFTAAAPARSSERELGRDDARERATPALRASRAELREGAPDDRGERRADETTRNAALAGATPVRPGARATDAQGSEMRTAPESPPRTRVERRDQVARSRGGELPADGRAHDDWLRADPTFAPPAKPLEAAVARETTSPPLQGLAEGPAIEGGRASEPRGPARAGDDADTGSTDASLARSSPPRRSGALVEPPSRPRERPAEPSHARSPAEASPPRVSIQIGRIDVRGVSAEPPRAPATRSAPQSQSLDAYLQRLEEKGR
jgi:hypothetical protein